MKVFVIRHGQSECNRLKLNCGWSSTPLSELGIKQAQEVGDYLKGVKFDRIYASDLPRAQMTAQNAINGCSPILSDKIREISVGTLSNVPIEENIKKYGEQYLDSVDKQDFSAFGGESAQQMFDRVACFMHELEEKENEVETVAVFGHEGTVHKMLEFVFDCRINLEHFLISNCSVTIFEYKNGNWKLCNFNVVK